MSDFLADSAYEAVIGLEVHAQLKTRTKIFCACANDFGGEPNSRTCPVCLGMPGVLPVLNRQAVTFAVQMALATGCTVKSHSVFARKNYFYPDLPKAYQISQFEEPLCEHGVVEFEDAGVWKRVGLTRIHLEEDAGKLIHPEGSNGGASRVDLNRCGTPLIEIVSEPEMRTPHEAALYLMTIRQLLLYLGICDGNMEEGSLRCDANVSVRKKGETRLGTKAELKNMNSFRNVERAVEFEIHRQIEVLESGGVIQQQTLTWDAARNVATTMRQKEDSHDYRYFPDPDLTPLSLDPAWVREQQALLPELPPAKRARFRGQYGLRDYDMDILTETPELADYFEAVAAAGADARSAGNWIITEVLGMLNAGKLPITAFSVTPAQLGALLGRIDDGTINGKIAKEVFEVMVETGGAVDRIIEQKGLRQISDDQAIRTVIRGLLDGHAADVQAYLSGKHKVVGFFVGQVMRETKGQANPQIVNAILKEELESRR